MTTLIGDAQGKHITKTKPFYPEKLVSGVSDFLTPHSPDTEELSSNQGAQGYGDTSPSNFTQYTLLTLM